MIFKNIAMNIRILKTKSMLPARMTAPQYRPILLLICSFFTLLTSSRANAAAPFVHVSPLIVSRLKSTEDKRILPYVNDTIDRSINPDKEIPMLAHPDLNDLMVIILPNNHVAEAMVTRQSKVENGEVVLDLHDLLGMALRNNRMIEIARQQKAQSEGQLTMTRSGYLPQLAVKGRYSYTERKDAAGTKETTTIGDQQTETVTNVTESGDVAEGSVNLSQTIYDFGKTTGAVDVSKANKEASEAHLQRETQGVIFKVKKAYYAVLEKTRLIDVAQESVKSFQQQLDRTKIYQKAGSRTKIDIINAEIELSNEKMGLLKAQYALKTAKVALEQVIGIQPNQGAYQIRDDGMRFDTISEVLPAIPENLNGLIGDAMALRLDLMQMNSLTEAARHNIVRARGEYKPTIKAEASYENYDTKLELYKDSWEVAIALSWELFSGFHTQGAVAEAQAHLLEIKAQHEDLQLNVSKEVTEAYLQAAENRDSVLLALQTLAFANENLVLATKRYETGAFDVIEFNEAQLSLTRTRNKLVASYYAYLSGLAGIEFAVGVDMGNAKITAPRE